MKKLLNFDEIKSNDNIPENAYTKNESNIIINNRLFLIIIEFDKNQNKMFSSECEIGRMINLYKNFNKIPIMFVRYNPDEYINNLGTLIKPFKVLNYRPNVLSGVLRNLKHFNEWNIPLSVIYLFYDGYDIPKIQAIDIVNKNIKILDLSM
jgi:hypothetical protein